MTFSYVLGEVLGTCLSLPVFLTLFLLIITGGLTLLFAFSKKDSAILLCLVIVLFGIFSYQNAKAIPKNDISLFADDRYVKVEGSIIDEPSSSDSGYSFTVKARSLQKKGRTFKVSGLLRAYTKDLRPLCYGNKISIYGKLSKITSTSNPGIASYTDLMARKKIFCQIMSGPPVKVISRNCGNPVKSLAIIIKNRLISVIQKTMEEPYASLLGSIVFGSQASPISSDLQDSYRTAGVIHLLVVSGTQVSIILSVISLLFGNIGLTRPQRFIAMSAVNAFFAIMVGAGPSIVRASLMAEAALATNLIGRKNDFYNSLCLSALVLLIFDPLDLFDIGFQLSFAATWALFYLAPVLEEKMSGHLPGFFTSPASISIAPTLATAPIILFSFGQISFVSIITNFIIVPWVEVAVILGFFDAIAGIIFLPLAAALGNTLTLILILLNAIIYFFSGLPFACRYFAPPGLLLIAVYYIILIGGIEQMRGKSKIERKYVAAVILLAVVLLFGFGRSQAAQELSISVIDVGQGDSILIESPSGQKALIDGGGRQFSSKPDPTGRSIVVPYLRKKGINELNLLVLTHPHDDHVGGLVYLLEKMKVDLVLDSGQPHTAPNYVRFLELIGKKNIPFRIARAGQVVDLGGGVKGYVLSPSEPLIIGTISDLNNNSVVIRLVYGNTSILLMGDAAFEAEDRIIGSNKDLKSDILKVGHHGSATSTSQAFLDAVRPEYAVISVGAKNKFSHPNGGTLLRLQDAGAKIFRTDLNGSITITSDGNKVSVHPAKL